MTPKKQTLVGALAIATAVILAAPGVRAATRDYSVSAGVVRVTTATLPSTCTAVLQGVGTAMSVSDYDNVAAAIAAYGYVVVTLDHAVGNLIKTDATAFGNLVRQVRANLRTWVSPGCSAGITRWIVGGHSASGQAAHNAILADPSLADAVFSMDPYNISGLGTLAKSGLYWGFSSTTCFVTINDAAKAAYYRTAPHRVFHRASTSFAWKWCGYIPRYHHCSFSDGGCLGCSNCAGIPPGFYTDVAQSVNKFITALASGNWQKSNLTLTNPQTPVTTFVDADQP
jgi:hypothetical protein